MLWFRQASTEAHLGRAEAVLAVEPGNLRALCEVGYCRYRDDRPEEAVVLLKRAVDLGGRDPYLWRVIGKSLLRMWRLRGAETFMHDAREAFEQSMRHPENRKDPEYVYDIAVAYMDFRATEGAINMMAAFIVDFPTCPFLDRVILTAAVCLKQLRSYGECVRLLHNIVDEPPRPYLSGHVLFLLGRVYQLSNHKDLSQQAFAQSFRASLHAGDADGVPTEIPADTTVDELGGGGGGGGAGNAGYHIPGHGDHDNVLDEGGGVGGEPVRSSHLWSVHPRTWLCMGFFFLDQGDFLVAVDFLEEAVRRSAAASQLHGGKESEGGGLRKLELYDMWIKLARGYSASHRRPEATAAAESALSVWPYGVAAREMLVTWRRQLWKLPFDTEANALFKIQASARRALARMRFDVMRPHILGAAAEIQRCVRGWLMMRWFRVKRGELRAEFIRITFLRRLASTRIQAWTRCCLCSRRLKRLRRTTTHLQRVVRGHLARNFGARLRQAIEEAFLRSLHQGATLLQARFRGHAARVRRRRGMAAVDIQRMWRAARTRRRIRRVNRQPEQVGAYSSGFPTGTPGHLTHWRARLARSQALYAGKVQLLRRVAQVRRGDIGGDGGREAEGFRGGGGGAGVRRGRPSSSTSSRDGSTRRRRRRPAQPSREDGGGEREVFMSGPGDDIPDDDGDSGSDSGRSGFSEDGEGSGDDWGRWEGEEGAVPSSAAAAESRERQHTMDEGVDHRDPQLQWPLGAVSREEAFCALAEANGDVARAVDLLQEDEFAAEVRELCGSMDVTKYISFQATNNWEDKVRSRAKQRYERASPMRRRMLPAPVERGDVSTGATDPPDGEQDEWLPMARAGDINSQSARQSGRNERGGGQRMHSCTQRNCIRCNVSRVMGRERRRHPHSALPPMSTPGRGGLSEAGTSGGGKSRVGGGHKGGHSGQGLMKMAMALSVDEALADGWNMHRQDQLGARLPAAVAKKGRGRGRVLTPLRGGAVPPQSIGMGEMGPRSPTAVDRVSTLTSFEDVLRTSIPPGASFWNE